MYNTKGFFNNADSEFVKNQLEGKINELREDLVEYAVNIMNTSHDHENDICFDFSEVLEIISTCSGQDDYNVHWNNFCAGKERSEKIFCEIHEQYKYDDSILAYWENFSASLDFLRKFVELKNLMFPKEIKNNEQSIQRA